MRKKIQTLKKSKDLKNIITFIIFEDTIPNKDNKSKKLFERAFYMLLITYAY